MQVGHVYSYQARPTESGSSFTVLKIDQIKGESVVSVAITGLHVKSAKSPDGEAKEVGHFPIALAALLKSAPVDTGEVRSVTWPNEGYDAWREAVDTGKGGYWKLPLAECIAAMEGVLSK